MASENAELVRSIYAVWERGDYAIEWPEWADPEIEFVIADGPLPGRWRGPAVADGYRAILSVWEDFRVKADECLEVDGERVLVLTRFSGRGKTSGLELGQMRAEGAGVFHVRDGKVMLFVHYWDRERALADLGLPRDPAT